ncbi:hypothetical protein GCM10022210_26420 [Mucilaginibacter dorajii]|uniref:Uncharacterized protein n=1 Tax=Mucilaginibacter dorajii TaxID=692994 RepID=A0ABP7Q1I3_9SPHI
MYQTGRISFGSIMAITMRAQPVRSKEMGVIISSICNDGGEVPISEQCAMVKICPGFVKSNTQAAMLMLMMTRLMADRLSLDSFINF